jgi:hypothetical protein
MVVDVCDGLRVKEVPNYRAFGLWGERGSRNGLGRNGFTLLR